MGHAEEGAVRPVPRHNLWIVPPLARMTRMAVLLLLEGVIVNPDTFWIVNASIKALAAATATLLRGRRGWPGGNPHPLRVLYRVATRLENRRYPYCLG